MPLTFLQSPYIIDELFKSRKDSFRSYEIFPLTVSTTNANEVIELKSIGWTELPI